MADMMELVQEFEELVTKVNDGEVRKQLRQEFEKRATSRLAKRVIEVTAERDELRRGERFWHYKKAGVPEQAHELLDQTYDGREVTLESVQDLARTNGFAVEGDKEPQPGDPDYVWSSPLERRLYEERQSDE